MSSVSNTFNICSVLFSIKQSFFFPAMLGLCCCIGFSLIAASGGYSLVAVCGLLTVVASLVAEHGLSGTQASVVADHRL